MWTLPKLLEGVTEEKARGTIIKLWIENESLKSKHPPPDNIPEALHILDAKGGGDAELRHCMGLLNKAYFEKRMRQ